METKKYVIEVKELDDIPVDWANRDSWEGEGFFYCRKENAFYCVGYHSTSYLGKASWLINTPLVEDIAVGNSESEIIQSISESLFLKAIAAASRAEVLK